MTRGACGLEAGWALSKQLTVTDPVILGRLQIDWSLRAGSGRG